MEVMIMKNLCASSSSIKEATLIDNLYYTDGALLETYPLKYERK